jgi:hypothetical protein
MKECNGERVGGLLMESKLGLNHLIGVRGLM